MTDCPKGISFGLLSYTLETNMVEMIFWHILRLGLFLVCGGLATLVLVIPFAGKIPGKTSTRTDFFSARAAYWCVIAGLAILVLMSTGIAVRTAMGVK